LNLSGEEKQKFKNSYRAIAFTGQVSVEVVGETSKGDYLLPNRENDETAVPVSEEEISFNQYRDELV
jgi:hypothetical protein